MKTNSFLLILFTIIAFGLTDSYYQGRFYDKQKELIEERFNQLDSIMQHRSELDSLYWNHLEECAFELKNELSYSNYN